MPHGHSSEWELYRSELRTSDLESMFVVVVVVII